MDPHWLVEVAAPTVCISSESSAGGLDTVASGVGLNAFLDLNVSCRILSYFGL